MAHAATIVADANTKLWNATADEHDPISTRTFGFWLYMMSDGLIFASLFASYAVLDGPMNAAGHPMAAQLLSASQGMVQTILILASVLALSVGTLSIKTGNKAGVSLGLLLAALLAVVFLFIGSSDLEEMTAAGNGATASAYLSVLFTLIITHGLHMGFGLLWMAVLLVQIARSGFTTAVVGRLLCLRMFWQFQASVWVIVYVYVYLFGGAH
jgi:cytochrome o ubiquinol oxidase subunit 3